MPLELQVKLLRVLQEKEIERVGGRAPIPVNVRILCATAKDLSIEVEKGSFRSDLLYRLQVIPIKIPPLRERDGDTSQLTDFFLEGFGRERGMTFDLSKEARLALEQYPYPGNVRELRNILERASVLAPSHKIQLWDLPVETHGGRTAPSLITERLTDAVANAEKLCIRRALDKTGDNKTEAAVMLGISRKNLWEKMKAYDL
ncbi:MAG: sigma 54-interacting transcriptional regulator, partial [Desulfuromonadales bacterium]|nr:sigma 54-interacting transcriptional regulator [Desulfuromonadales bacterium]